MQSPLLYLINKPITLRQFLSSCKVVKVKPLFKNGDKCNVCNYWPVSQLPVVSKFKKLPKKAIFCQLIAYLEDNNLFCARQNGFKQSKSTKLALIDFVNECCDAVEAGEIVRGVLVNLSKIFDYVITDLLSIKLSAVGIKSVALRWINSYLSDRHQLVEI